MIRVTKQQRDNLLEAMNVMWPSVPERNVSNRLRRWRDNFDWRDSDDAPPTCDTVACFGGWCAWWPPFRAQGVRACATGAPTIGRHGCYPIDPCRVARNLFGDSLLFLPRGMHPADEGVPPWASDHRVVKERLYWLLHASEVKL